MKPRSLSESSFKNCPPSTSRRQPPEHSPPTVIPKPHDTLKRQSSYKITAKTQRKQSPFRIQIIGSLANDLERPSALSERKNSLSKPSTSLFKRNPNPKHPSILPKVNPLTKNSDVSRNPIEPSLELNPKQGILSKVEMVINSNVGEKVNKVKLRQNMLEEIEADLKRHFRLRIVNGTLETKSLNLTNLQKFRARDWEAIQNTLTALDIFTKRHSLKGSYQLNYFQFVRLVHLPKPSNRQIICSFELPIIPEEMARIPGAQFVYEDALVKASTKIQSIVKMWRDRKEYLQHQSYLGTVRYIQAFWRRRLLVVKTRKVLKERYIQKREEYKEISKRCRERWYLDRNQVRWEVHVPNLGRTEFCKLTTDKHLQKQLSHIIGIFKTAHNFLVNIILVTPLILSEEIVSYYSRIFSLNNIADWRSRVKFVHPENSSKFSTTISTSRLLLESPVALGKIKRIVRGGPAFLVLSESSPSDMELSIQLRIPVFGGGPETQYLNTQSGSYSLFKSAQIPTLKTAKDIYSEEELVNTISILTLQNPNTHKWILKIDDQTQGRGEAFLSPSTFPMIKTLLENFQQIKELPEASDLEEEILKALAEEVKESLHSKLRIASKDVYRTSKEYLSQFYTRGGVVIQPIHGKVDILAIGFAIFPGGELEIIQATKQLRVGGKVVACISPLQEDVFKQSEYLVKAVHRELYGRGNIGNFTLQITCQKYNNNAESKYLCSDLKCYIDTSSSHCYLMGLTNETSLPSYLNTQATSCVYCPLVSVDGLSKEDLRNFFQQCRYSNIEFDTKTKQGVLFLLSDTLQSECLSLMVIADTYEHMLDRLMAALEFLGGYSEKPGRSRESASAMKSKVGTLLGQIKRRKKQDVETNLEWLF